MTNVSLAVLVSSTMAMLVFFLVGEASSFQLVPEGKASLHCSGPMNAVDSETSWSLPKPRRAFFADFFSKGATAAGICSTPIPRRVMAEDSVSAGIIKVTAIAHTFLTTGKSPSPKPIRENDATRYFTNAKVVYVFEGSSNSDNGKLAQEVIDLTRQRKAEQGPGVTPGNLLTLVPGEKIVDRVVEKAKQMPEGDVLVVGPIPSLGTAGDGRLLASTASGLGTFVGGQKGQGVISVLLNGPKENLKLIESGFPVSELLWYSLPPRK